jgi:hypothetical protein
LKDDLGCRHFLLGHFLSLNAGSTMPWRSKQVIRPFRDSEAVAAIPLLQSLRGLLESGTLADTRPHHPFLQVIGCVLSGFH